MIERHKNTHFNKKNNTKVTFRHFNLSLKFNIIKYTPSMIVFGVFGVGVFTFGIFASFGNDENMVGVANEIDMYILIF